PVQECPRPQHAQRQPSTAARSGDGSCDGAGGAPDRQRAARGNAEKTPPENRRPSLVRPGSKLSASASGFAQGATPAPATNAGSSRTKVAPPVDRLLGSTQTRPPFASAKPLAIASPRPLPGPALLPRSKASKILSRSVSAMRGP